MERRTFVDDRLGRMGVVMRWQVFLSIAGFIRLRWLRAVRKLTRQFLAFK
jgi:hypothetical protein